MSDDYDAGTSANLEPPDFGVGPEDLRQLDILGAAFSRRLRAMYAGEPCPDANGTLASIDDTTRISVHEGMFLYSEVVSTGAVSTLEVGFAYGFSTMYVLAGLAANGGGRHVAIDPYQYSDWRGIGVTTARSAMAGEGLPPDSLTLLEERSDAALVDLRRRGAQFEVTFVDGYHRFDDVLVDFTLAAPMCPIGGAIVLHDMWLGSIAAVAGFLRANRPDFVELETGCQNLFAVRRVALDERNWNHFVSFPMR